MDSLDYNNVIYCAYCGKSILKDSIFCENCGRSLSNQIIEEIKKYIDYTGEETIFQVKIKNTRIRLTKNKHTKYNNIKIKVQPKEILHAEETHKANLELKKADTLKLLGYYLESSIAEIDEIRNNIYAGDRYLTYELKTNVEKEIGEHQKNFYYLQSNSKKISEDIGIKANELMNKSNEILFYINNYNENFIAQKKLQYAPLFRNDGIELDDDQKRAVITDDKYNLVVAGAGSGKTEVLITRIAYLTQREKDKIKPERILALAFQTKAAKEIKERLQKRYGVDIEIRTFHALGNKILDDCAKEKGLERPHLKSELTSDKGYIKYIENIFDKEISENLELQNDTILFMKKYGDNEAIKNKEDLSTAEFIEYQRNLRYTTLDGTKVKSESEREIMNFFLTHKLNGKNIKILYEQPASWMEYKNNEGQIIQPKPDFYFPVFDIYLEHWSLNSKGKVPPWYGGENPTEKYNKGREIKKKKFRENNKILIETFQSEFEQGPIEPILKERFLHELKKINPTIEYEIEPLSYKEITEKVWDECREFVKYLPKNISKFIRIAKTYNLSPPEIELKLESSKWSPKQVYFGKIALKIFEKYEKSLGKDIDFEDMINRASDCLRENEHFYENVYDHILVDEYQDISMQRNELIKQLMGKNPNAKLFCVGDDWQSIMGFAGSNLDFFINFEKYFQNHVRTDLTKNYRSIKSIVDTGSEIIKNNKNYLEKKTLSNSDIIKPIKIYSILHSKEYRDKYYKQMAWHCLNKIKEIKEKDNIRYSDFMILLRISKLYKLNNELNKYAKLLDIPIKEVGIGDCVRVMTVHRSKGLQSKYVFILNVDKDIYGFPCEIENPAIFEPAIGKNDFMREEEERRLFYVALTRAKEGVFIYTQKCMESKFISELKDLEFVEREELKYEIFN